jgi:hypothetical protein
VELFSVLVKQAGGKRRWPTRRPRLWVLLPLLLAAGAFVGPANTNHVPGATYKGTHAGGQGSVWLVVSPGGGAVTRFYVDGVPGNGCSYIASNFVGAYPITEDPHSFSITVDETEWVYGTFRDPQKVEGTLHLGGHGSSCQSQILTWNATVTDEPAPPPPGGGPPRVRCRVPRVVGLSLARARTQIRRSRCSVGRIRHIRSTRPRGRVISQAPSPGSVLTHGTPVRLTVSRGR